MIGRITFYKSNDGEANGEKGPHQEEWSEITKLGELFQVAGGKSPRLIRSNILRVCGK